MVKKGYKQTEVGIIPESWEVINLKSIVIGNLKYGINAAAIPYNSKFPQYLRITDITEDGRFSKKNRTSVKVLNLDSYWLHFNDIVFARTGASTGKTYLYKERDGDMVYAGFLIKASIDTAKADPAFIFYQFHTNRYWNWVTTSSQRSGQPGINSKEYGSFDIILPKLEEQTAIATALSDIDNLIDNLEKLIEKKKKIKQGTMQELLTGKKRLPGFGGKGYKQTEIGMIPEDWAVQSFADTFRILNNNTFSRAELNYVSGQFRNIHYGDILIRFPEVLDCTRDDVPYINDGVRISASAQVLQNGDIVMADTAEDETVGKVTEVMNTSQKPVLSGLHTIPCRVKVGEFVPKWLGYYMNSHLYHDQLLPYIHGTKVSSVSKSSLGRTAIIVPTTEEQERIVETLSDMDEEITALNKKLAKTKLLKQGMMQKLLTGEIRLLK